MGAFTVCPVSTDIFNTGMTRETKSRGYLPALLSSARNLLGREQDAAHRALGRDAAGIRRGV